MNSDTISDLLIASIRTTVPELADHPIGRNDAMADLGVDSMERSEIIIATLEAIGLEVPMVQLHGPRNIGELADRMHAKQNS